MTQSFSVWDTTTLTKIIELHYKCGRGFFYALSEGNLEKTVTLVLNLKNELPKINNNVLLLLKSIL